MAAHELKTFPGLRAKSYDSPAHHFHSPGSPGALCVNCHMPARKYMGIDARRDHAIRIPRPDLTVKIGTPNVCSGCHADRTPEWAADAIARWYGPDRRHEAHYGEVLAAGRAGQRGAEESLLNLARDSSEPAIVRATALERPPALRAREPSGERRGHAGPRPRGADRCRGQPRARSSRRARVARRPVARRSGARRPHRGGACALVRAVPIGSMPRSAGRPSGP